MVLPCFLLVEGPASLFAWSLAMGTDGRGQHAGGERAAPRPRAAERRQSVLALNYTAMSVAYTLGVMPAGYVAEQGYGYLAAIGAAGYVLVALLFYAFALRGALPLERAPAPQVLFDGLRDAILLRFAAVAFIFPFSMGLRGLGDAAVRRRRAAWARATSAWCWAPNSILVAVLALPVAARIESARAVCAFLAAAALLVAAAHRLLRRDSRRRGRRSSPAPWFSASPR